MKTITLIDTRLEVPGVSLGILVSTHPDMMAAFAANDTFQKAEASGRHIRTKIVTLKDRLDLASPSSRRTWPKANELSAIPPEEAEQIAADLRAHHGSTEGGVRRKKKGSAALRLSAEGDLAQDWELFDGEDRKPSTVQRSFHRGVHRQRKGFSAKCVEAAAFQGNNGGAMPCVRSPAVLSTESC
jgi:hypothetical protein